MNVPQNLKKYFKKRWAKGTAIGIIVLAVIVTLLPVVVKMVIEDWYRDQGVESVEIGDVDLNLFTGTFAVEGLEVKDNAQVVLSVSKTAVNLSLIDLLSKQIHVEEIDVKDFLIRIDRPMGEPMKVAGISIGGEEPPEKKERNDEESSWEFGVSVTRIDNFDLHYKDDKIESDFTLRKVNLLNAFTWTPDNIAVLALEGEINSKPVSIEAEFRPFARSPTFKGKLKIDGVKLDEFAELAKPAVAKMSGEIHLDTAIDVTLVDGKLLDAKADGEYQIKLVSVELSDQIIEVESFKVAGATEVKQQSDEQADKKTSVKFDGTSNAKLLTVIEKVSNLKLASLGETSIESIEVNELENIKAGKVLLTDLVMLSENEAGQENAGNNEINTKKKEKALSSLALANLGSADFTNIQLMNFNNLEIAGIVLDQVTAFISKNEKGDIQLLSKLGGENQKKEHTKEKSNTNDRQADSGSANEGVEEAGDTGSQGFRFKIGSAKVTGKSEIKFRDASVLPKFASDVDIQKLEIGNIDNASKDGDSPFLVKAKIDKYSEFDADGKIKLFSGTGDISFVASLKNYELPHLSSYTSQVLGYDLVSGQGNLKVNAKKDKDKIDGEAKLKLNNLTVKETNPEYMKKLNEQLSIPLGMALSLLRDSNDDIKLKIPITGDLFKPDVGVGDIINTALGNALKGATMAYLKYAFQPFGTLISIVQVAGKAVGSIQLDPVNYSAGDSALDAESSGYLQKIAELVQGRKGVRIKLCGISVEADRTVLLQQKIELAKNSKAAAPTDSKSTVQPDVTNDELFALAKDRAEVIKHQLVTQFKIDPARLFVCHPEIRKENDAKPSVELLI